MIQANNLSDTETANIFNRSYNINKINQEQDWDVIVIGGGATGLGTALDSVTRGFKTLLIEKEDFTKGTSSRSTKLVHGGVRYLAQGNVSLVLEALRERGLMKKNAPHLVKDQSFIIPSYNWWAKPFYTIGLTLYDLMAGHLGLGRSLPYSRKKTLECVPTLKLQKLRGGIVYHDGQFDDSRYAINLLQTILEKGGVASNYMKVTHLLKSEGKVSGVKVIDIETEKEYNLKSKVVINATGIFVDSIIKMDNPQQRDIVKVSQGVHLVLDKEFLPKQYAIMIPKTSDGRVLFAVPWHDKVIVGTTDIPKDNPELEPKALDEEIDFILDTAQRFLAKPLTRANVQSVFAGLRPLAAPESEGKKTKEISRGHKILVGESGLVTITGGKWTTYRKMAQDTMDKAMQVIGGENKKSATKQLKIHGYKKNIDLNNPMYFYGSDEEKINELIKQDESLAEIFDPALDINKAQVVWAVRNEMARKLEDVLARRTRVLLLDAKKSVEIAPMVAQVMADELNENDDWVKNQVDNYKKIAENYILK